MSLEKYDSQSIRALLERIADELRGDWLLVGGALVAVWFEQRRTTEDLDLIGMTPGGELRYRLLDFICRLGMPVEAVNSAADYFVHRIPDWQEHVTPFLKGKASTIYRPDATLFLLLKVDRMSEQDFEDCRLLLEYCAREATRLDVSRVLAAASVARQESQPGAEYRRRQLSRLLGEFALPAEATE